MAKLTIKNFSCIDSAEIDVGKLTVIIGPQASGKSVISKVLYFCYDLIDDLINPFRQAESLPQFVDKATDDFVKSFPPSAWGSLGFQIRFNVGPIEIDISRAKPRKSSIGKLKISLGDFLEQQFATFNVELANAREKVSKRKGKSSFVDDFMWSVTKNARERIATALGNEYVSTQLFIPAGRSFFTNMGRAAIAFEQGGFLDPLTIRFGKQFLSFRQDQDNQVYFYHPTPSRAMAAIRSGLVEKLFSGQIVIERNDAYVKATDGRRIPFSVLSSGQQELLPLWLTLNGFIDQFSGKSLIYIEEPEAHLFPSAQGALAAYLAQILATVSDAKMLITTHSPYMLTVVNNLLQAGKLSTIRDKKHHAAIESIVPREQWVLPDQTTAYAIIDRNVFPIMDSSGLIDAEYLDNVSSDIGETFMQLLAIEASQ